MDDIKDIDQNDIDMLSGDINEHFSEPYHLSEFRSVGLDETYVLSLAVNSNDQILAGLSSNTIVIYDGMSLSKLQEKTLPNPVINVKFSPVNPALFYSGSCQAVQLWDLRTKNEEAVFEVQHDDNDKRYPKPLTTFDVNCEDKFLAAGTEVVNHDAFLLFWDIRSKKMVGGYWETLGEDLTALTFAGNDPNKLVTASADGQVNVFDISQESEDEALVTSLNVEAPVRSTTWIKENRLAILLDHEEAVLWKPEDSEAYKTFNREDFTIAIRRKVTAFTYVGGCHFDASAEKAYFLAGSSSPTNPCLRILNLSKTKMKPVANLPIGSSKQKNTVVRSSALAKDGSTFVTGNENGLICVWSKGPSKPEDTIKEDLKSKKEKGHSKKPYSKK